MKHPNAATSLVAGGGLGELVHDLAAWAGYDLPPRATLWIAAGLSTVALFIGRNGLRGVARMIWRGTGSPPA